VDLFLDKINVVVLDKSRDRLTWMRSPLSRLLEISHQTWSSLQFQVRRPQSILVRSRWWRLRCLSLGGSFEFRSPIIKQGTNWTASRYHHNINNQMNNKLIYTAYRTPYPLPIRLSYDVSHAPFPRWSIVVVCCKSVSIDEATGMLFCVTGPWRGYSFRYRGHVISACWTKFRINMKMSGLFAKM